jgi:hypothetical protein
MPLYRNDIARSTAGFQSIIVLISAEHDPMNMNVRLLLLLAPVALSPVAMAQPDGSPLEPLFECRALVDDSARLACLDAAVDALRGDTESGEVVAVDRNQIEAAEEATYGLSIPGFSLPSLPSLSLPRLANNSEDLAEADESSSSADRVLVRDDSGRIERIENLGVASIGETPYGRLVITLQNGQVWTQIDDTHIVLPRRLAENEMTAAIRNASLGSYMFQLNNRGRWFRAERSD